MCHEFERVSPEAVGIHSEVIEEMLDKLEESKDCEPHGIMIMRDGKICAEGWWQPYGAKVPHTLFSVTKTYTATAIGIAYTEGLLSLDDLIVDKYPEYASINNGEYLNRLRIRDALMMASGKPEIRCDTADWEKHYFEMPFKYEPGTVFSYNCEDTHILMGIIKKVSGQGLNDYLKPRLFEKIGIDSDNLKWVYLPDGSEIGCGGLFATTEDNLRLMKLYLQGGVWNNERILASDFVRLATTKRIDNSTYVKQNKYKEADIKHLTAGYGFQIWMAAWDGAYYASGALGQFAAAIPDLDMVISFNQTSLSNNNGISVSGINIILDTLLPSVKAKTLPPNPEASEKLYKRMNTLSLGNPKCSRCPSVAKKISGKKYRVVNGVFTLRSSIWNQIANASKFYPVIGAEWLKFDFNAPDVCIFSFFEHGKEISLQVGLDGIRRLNSYAMENTNIDKVVLDGSWINDNTFILNARWIETCYSITVAFCFIESMVEISAVRIAGDWDVHPLRDKVVIGLTP